jgi:hypothetical protein
MIVVFDEGPHLPFEIARQVVIVEQNAVLQGLVSALDLSLGLGMIRSGRIGMEACVGAHRLSRKRQLRRWYVLAFSRSSPRRRERDFCRRRQAPENVPKRLDLYAETQEPRSRSRKTARK